MDDLQKNYRRKFFSSIPKELAIHKKVIRNLEKKFFVSYASNGISVYVLELNENEIEWTKNSKFMEENNLLKELENKNIMIVSIWNRTILCKTYKYFYLKFKNGSIDTEYSRGQEFIEFIDLYNIKFCERKYAPYPLQLKSIYKMYPSLREYVKEYLKALSETNIFIKDLVKDLEKNSHSLMAPIDFSLLEIAKNKKHLLEIKTKTKLTPIYNRISLNHAYSVIKAKKYINENELNKLLVLDSDIYSTSIIYEKLRIAEFFSKYFSNRFNIVNSGHFSNIMYDFIDFHKKLKIKINLNIKSYNRFLDIHDDLAKKMISKTNKIVIKKNNPFLQLKLPHEFELIDNIERLYDEGVVNKNCVFTYLDKINKEKCIIYTTIWRKKKYTIEFAISQKKFILQQISGYRNSPAPKTLKNKINKLLENQKVKSA